MHITKSIQICFCSVFLFFIGNANTAVAQLTYNESFNPLFNTNTLALGWTQGTYGAVVDIDNYWHRVTTGSFPAASPHSGSGMMVYNSFFSASGAASYLSSKKLSLQNTAAIPAAGAPFSFWMYRSSGFPITSDKIEVYINTTPNMSGTPVGPLVETSTLLTTIRRNCSLPPLAVVCNGWNQYNYTIPTSLNGNGSVYIIILATSGYGEDMYIDDLSVTSYPNSQTYVANSASVFVQFLSSVPKNSVNQPIIGCKLTMAGAMSPKVLTKMTFNTNGSTSPPTDITNAKLWFSGGTNIFSTENAILLGTYSQPWSIQDTFLINSPYYSGAPSFSGLEVGENYFWLTYNIPPNALSGNYVDAEWVQLNISGTGNITPNPQSLPGARPIGCTLPPTMPGSIVATGGNTPVCPGNSKTYSVSPAAGATSYTWSPPAGSTITSGQGTVSVNVMFNAGFTTSDTLRVVSNNSCGSSAQRKLNIPINSPSTPGTITALNGTKACPGDVHVYSIAPVTNATSYTWTAPPGGIVTAGQGTTTATVTYGAGFLLNDTLKVKSINGCGSSANKILKITRNNPAIPAAITGQKYNLCNQTAIPFGTTNVSGMIYNWSFSAIGATVASGQGSENITADFGAGFLSATLSVNATNGCGTGPNRNLVVYAKPAAPGPITGLNSVCMNQQNVPYSITPMTNITNYTWMSPTGAHVSDGVTTSGGTTLTTIAASVTVDYATSGGNVKVRANNACASGSYSILAVAMPCREGIFNEENDNELIVIPNPNNGTFVLQSEVMNKTNATIQIMDAFGKLVYQQLSGNSVNQNFELNLAPGLYFVYVQSNDVTQISKMVVSDH